jgi:hypothetical protein
MHLPRRSVRNVALALSCLAVLTIHSEQGRATCLTPHSLVPFGTFATGTNPHAAVIGDFNGDGFPDVVVANSGSGTVSFHPGNGTCTFASGPSFAVPGQPFGVIADDFDRDGIPDLVAASYNTSTLSLLRGVGSGGKGTGTFEPAVAYPAGTNPTFALAADLNQDGRPDVVALNLTAGTCTVLLAQPPTGPGQGVFSAPTSYVLGDGGSFPATAAFGDFNHDGILDLVVSLYGRNQLVIMLGNGAAGAGDGTFGTPAYFDVGNNPWNVEARDINGDGVVDLIFSDALGLGTMLGLGSSSLSFAPMTHVPSPDYPQGMAFGDFNRDGILDVVLGIARGSGLEFYAGQGSGGPGLGAFANGIPVSSNAQTFALASSDLNGDGNSDLISVNFYVNSVAVYQNNCPESILAPVGQWTPQGEPICATSGDQTLPVGVADGLGGAYFAWRDARSATGSAIYALHVDALGHPIAGWTANGIPICPPAGNATSPAIVADGTGGALIGWLDSRTGISQVFMQHLLSNGALASGWPPDGLLVTSTGPQESLSMDADGFGGVIFAAQDERQTFGPQSYAFRITGQGTSPTGWTSAGKQLTNYHSGTVGYAIYLGPLVVSDGGGGGNVATYASKPQGPDFDGPWDKFDVQSAGSLGVATVYELPRFSVFSGADGLGGTIVGFAAAGGGTTVSDLRQGGAIAWSGHVSGADHYQAVGDGSGGAILVGPALSGSVQSFTEFRIGPSGAAPIGWNAVGLPIVSGMPDIRLNSIAPDGGGGVFSAWTDFRYGRQDLFAVHTLGSGATDAGWQTNGEPVFYSTASRSDAVAFSDQRGGAILVWNDSRHGDQDVFAQLLTAGMPVAAIVSLVGTEAVSDRVRITWQAPSGEASLFDVQRCESSGQWALLSTIGADGGGRLTLEDHQVKAAHRYGYRIGVHSGATSSFSEPIWVDVPAAPRFDVRPIRPNPVAGNLTVELSVPDAGPSRFEILDVTGRRVVSRAFSMEAGNHQTLQIASTSQLGPGVLFLRVTHGTEVRTQKFAVLR